MLFLLQIDFLIIKIDKCGINLDRQHNISIHWYIGCLHGIEIQIFKKFGYLIGWKKELDNINQYLMIYL